MTMRALTVCEPWGLNNLTLVELPEPVPGPGEVRLRMKAVSLNFRDWLIANGGHVGGALSQNSIIPFGDGCGIVDALGDGVTRVSVGERVIPTIIPKWIAGAATPERVGSALGMNIPGLGQEFVVVDQEALVKAPEFLTDTEVACLACGRRLPHQMKG